MTEERMTAEMMKAYFDQFKGREYYRCDKAVVNKAQYDWISRNYPEGLDQVILSTKISPISDHPSTGQVTDDYC